jgi:L-rhamnose-H+ transport protein
MQPNPFLGVVLHAIGGLAAASFYLPFKKVKGWSWETYWITGGVFSWLITPVVVGLIVISMIYAGNLFQIIAGSPQRAIFWAFTFGALWGIGGLTFGLSMRYLGIALGYAIALGACAAFGTLVPPIFEGRLADLTRRRSGMIVLAGVAFCLIGMGFSGAAGMSKERELSDEQKKATVAEFNFIKGLLVATVCGLLSACMAFALAAGDAITRTAMATHTPPIWAGLPTLVIILLGGLATNAVWCFVLLARNRSFGEFIGKTRSPTPPPPLLNNYFFAALVGVTWYFQFFFYTMGSSKMGERFGFSSWTLHMASIIIFSTIWGIALHEWKGSSRRTHALIAVGLATLIASTLVVGYGNYLGSVAEPH